MLEMHLHSPEESLARFERSSETRHVRGGDSHPPHVESLDRFARYMLVCVVAPREGFRKSETFALTIPTISLCCILRS